MTDATDSVPGTDPDRAGFTIAQASPSRRLHHRAGFTIALSATRDQLVLAAGIIVDTAVDLVEVVGRHVLARLLPMRRVRAEDRIVKRAISKDNARGPAIDRTTYQTTTSVSMLTTDP
ncbi:hypothetical protein ACIPLC_33900 [Kitasatospora sp. NPDC086801]|uniref:hypothetical protein n=1 Tax=Kitasatospora sp. NPDC086801 TaxID=3364066 RepID=UPI00380544EA